MMSEFPIGKPGSHNKRDETEVDAEEAIVSHIKSFLDFGPDSYTYVCREIHMVMEYQPGYF